MYQNTGLILWWTEHQHQLRCIAFSNSLRLLQHFVLMAMNSTSKQKIKSWKLQILSILDEFFFFSFFFAFAWLISVFLLPAFIVRIPFIFPFFSTFIADFSFYYSLYLELFQQPLQLDFTLFSACVVKFSLLFYRSSWFDSFYQSFITKGCPVHEASANVGLGEGSYHMFFFLRKVKAIIDQVRIYILDAYKMENMRLYLDKRLLYI